MLHDKHFRVLYYEADSAKVFPDTDIKGGVVTTYYGLDKEYEPIGVFIQSDDLRSIWQNVTSKSDKSLEDVISPSGLYKYSDKVYEERPVEMQQESRTIVASNCFSKFPDLFSDKEPEDGYDYIMLWGLENNKRCCKYIRKDYVRDNANLYKYKVLVPAANGSGAIGEVLSTPLIGYPLIGFTESFLSINETDSESEAENILKYVKTRFARLMLGVLKVTQHNSRGVWHFVPMQDFSSNSDIDWSKPVDDIDRQLYAKYGLNEREINFIETHVKEMK